MNVFFIDNFDSFTFNLVDDLRKRGVTVEIWRNDLTAESALAQALAMPAPRMIMLSPGPGHPEDAGCCIKLIQIASGRIPIFGVCLGLQSIVQALGGEVGYSGEVVHGKSVWIEHDETGIFASLPSPLQVGRYHSLAATRVPAPLEVVVRYHSLAMVVAHRCQPTLGVQFHPESILTPQGSRLITNVLSWAAVGQSAGKEGTDNAEFP